LEWQPQNMSISNASSNIYRTLMVIVQTKSLLRFCLPMCVSGGHVLKKREVLQLQLRLTTWTNLGWAMCCIISHYQ
jgi:hypothetical protein